MVRLFVLLFFVDLALLVVALIDCLSADGHEIRTLPKFVWVSLILLFSPIGSIGWFVAGRPQRSRPRPQTWHPAGSAQPRRPLAPDDNPQFLSELSARTRKHAQDRLHRWEAELRRREEELRRQESHGDGDKPDSRPLGEV